MKRNEWTGKLIELMHEVTGKGGVPYLALDNPAEPEGPGPQPIYSLLISYRNKIVKITIEEIIQ